MKIWTRLIPVLILVLGCDISTSQVVCPKNTTLSNEVCVSGDPTTICQNNPCIQPIICIATATEACPYELTCESDQILYNENCVSQPAAQCPCGYQVSSGHCVQLTPCESVGCNQGVPCQTALCSQVIQQPYQSASCPQIVQQPCQSSPCVQTPVPQPTPYPIQPQQPIYIPAPSPPDYASSPSDTTKIINITNVVNSTNMDSVVTDFNNTNINTINLASNAYAESEGGREVKYVDDLLQLSPTEKPEIIYVDKPYPDQPNSIMQNLPIVQSYPFIQNVPIFQHVLVPQPYPITPYVIPQPVQSTCAIVTRCVLEGCVNICEGSGLGGYFGSINSNSGGCELGNCFDYGAGFNVNEFTDWTNLIGSGADPGLELGMDFLNWNSAIQPGAESANQNASKIDDKNTEIKKS